MGWFGSMYTKQERPAQLFYALVSKLGAHETTTTTTTVRWQPRKVNPMNVHTNKRIHATHTHKHTLPLILFCALCVLVTGQSVRGLSRWLVVWSVRMVRRVELVIYMRIYIVHIYIYIDARRWPIMCVGVARRTDFTK